MNLMTMRYRGFTWSINPTDLRIECARRIKETALPFMGASAEDMGEKKRRVKGEGYFTGRNGLGQWRRLEELMRDGRAGYLQLPGQEPIWAELETLRLLGEEGEDLIKYEFSFIEMGGVKKELAEGRRTAAQGESLWDYAGRYGWDIERLREANPHIRDIACLQGGEEVYFP